MKRNKSTQNNRGFTLIEVLVALVVLSVGLLGVAGMQINGMRGNHSAFLRSQALQYSYEILDMMRANRNAAISSNNGENYNIHIPVNASGDYPHQLSAKESSAVVNAVTLADLQEWLRGLDGDSNPASGLPGGQGAIAVVDNGDSTWDVTVTVSWSEDRLADDTAPSVIVETKL